MKIISWRRKKMSIFATRKTKLYLPRMEQQIENKNIETEEITSKFEHFFEKNQKTIIIAIIAILVVVLAIFGLGKMKENRNAKANDALYAAEQYFAQGNYEVALNGNNDHAGFIEVANRYGSTKAGQRAKYDAGVCCLNLGQYEEAIKYLKSYKGKDAITKVEAVICQGDAELEMGNNKEAIAMYEKAAKMADNFVTTPAALSKAGYAYMMAGNYQKAVECFKQIKTKYPESSEYATIDKAIETAERLQ